MSRRHMTHPVRLNMRVDVVAVATAEPYSGMVFAQSLLPDGQSVVEQMGGLFVFVLIPGGAKR